MVNGDCFNKIKLFSLKRPAFLAVTVLVIVNLIFGNIVLAKKFEIISKDVERIKTGLNLLKKFGNIAISDDKLKTILNTTIQSGEVSTDITYGLLVLSALNEMDLIDMVISRRYSTVATEYFNQIIDERTNLISYWTNVGSDLPRILSGNVTGQMSASTLNSFAIGNMIIMIGLEVRNIMLVQMYDGLYAYFDARMNKSSHNEAWESARWAMSWVTEPEDIEYFKSLPFGHLDPVVRIDEKVQQLKLQFSALWDNWGPYVEIDRGVKEEFRQQVRDELGNAIISAIKTQQFVEEETKPSLLERAKISGANLVKELIVQAGQVKDLIVWSGQTVKRAGGNAITKIKSTVSQFNPFGAGVGLVPGMVKEEPSLKEEIPSEEVTPSEALKESARLSGEPGTGGPEPLNGLEEVQEDLDDISERIDVLDQATVELLMQLKPASRSTPKSPKTQEAEELEEEILEEEPLEEPEIGQEIGQEVGQELCQKLTEARPLLNQVILNEIAWMGTTNSANDEWIELKNISGKEIDLNGWQLLNKDQKIKIIFDVQHRVLNNGFLLLERTSDDSVSGIKADLIYTGAMKNSDEALYLFDQNCQLQDEVIASPNWPAGDNSSKRTMERKSDLGWQTSLEIGGTPKRENSSGYYPYYSGGGVSVSAPSSSKILISEIQISPIENRFIELYNPNDASVNLTNWYIQRKTEGGTSWESLITSTQFEGKAIQPKSYFLIARTLENADILKENLTLTENNSLVLKNPNREIVDKIGWGTAQEYETAPANNPLTNQSIGRKWSTSTQSYLDTDNNSTDFEIQIPTPKAQNQSLPNQPPTASFTFSPQIPFVGEEILFNASSSTDPDGQIVYFSWDFGDNNSTTTSQATTTYSYSTSGVEYIVRLQVQDNQGATSSATTTLIITERPILSVAINEIAWMGTATSSWDEWIELYNNTTSTVSLLNWTITWTQGTSTYSITISGATATIPAFGFYLLERAEKATDIAADFVYGGQRISNNGAKFELRGSLGNLIDSVDFSSGWPAGTASPDYLSMERINPRTSGSSANNWANNNQITKNGLDSQGNPINGTPKAQNSVYQSLPPQEVSNFAINLPNSSGNRVVLTWSTTTDPDTLQENLSYKIYYSKEAQVSEDNLTATSTFSATTSATTISIPDLSYNSTYYFGIKAFDGLNYSSLSTSSPYQTAILSTIVSGFPTDLAIKNQGRKIVRTSIGNFYVVYSRDSKIFLARSTDQGRNWTELPVTPDEQFEQKEPAIAIDSQNNLHLVWQGKISATSTYQIRYRKYNGGLQPIENLTNLAWDQELPVVAVDSQDRAHVVWVNNQAGEGSCPGLQILHKNSADNWQQTERVGDSQDSYVKSLALTIDSQNYLHVFWQGSIQISCGSSPERKVRYQKRTANWGPIISLAGAYLDSGFQSSIVIDSNDNLHLAWHDTGPYCGPDNAFNYYYLKYVKYTKLTDSWGEVSPVVSNCRYRVSSPSLALNFQDFLYLVWQGWDQSHYDKIYQLKYETSWEEARQVIEVSPVTITQKYPSSLWSFYPIVSGVKTNQPGAGYIFIYYQGTELKFYASQDLSWE